MPAPSEAIDAEHLTFNADHDLTWLAGLLYLDRRGRWVVAVPRASGAGSSLRIVATNGQLPETAVAYAQEWAANVLRRRDPFIADWRSATVLTLTGYIPARVPEHALTRPARDTVGTGSTATTPDTLSPAPVPAPEADRPRSERTLRVGVYYTAAFERRLQRYFETCHPQRQQLSQFGLHDALRWHVAHELDVPMADCDLVERHWIYEANSTLLTVSVEAFLAAAGISTHSTVQQSFRDHNEVATAVHVLDTAIRAGLDAVVLIAGSPLLIPLIERLRQHGVYVLVPRVAVPCPDEPSHDRHRIDTEFSLVQASSGSPTFDELLEPGLERRSRLAYPFHPKAQGPLTKVVDKVDDDPMTVRMGVVSRWDTGVSYGFVIESGTGRLWLAHHNDTPQDAGIRPATRVTFTGSPLPKPPKEIPKARHIAPISDGQLYPRQRRVTIADPLSWLPAADEPYRPGAGVS